MEPIRAGDWVRVEGCPYLYMNGIQALVLSEAEPTYGITGESLWHDLLPEGEPMHRLDLPPAPPGGYVAMPARWLQKIDPDWRAKGEWSGLAKQLCKPRGVDA